MPARVEEIAYVYTTHEVECCTHCWLKTREPEIGTATSCDRRVTANGLCGRLQLRFDLLDSTAVGLLVKGH